MINQLNVTCYTYLSTCNIFYFDCYKILSKPIHTLDLTDVTLSLSLKTGNRVLRGFDESINLQWFLKSLHTDNVLLKAQEQLQTFKVKHKRNFKFPGKWQEFIFPKYCAEYNDIFQFEPSEIYNHYF